MDSRETKREQVVRQMAREDRFCRRVLAESLREFLIAAKAGKVRARMMQSPSIACPRNLYVFVRFHKDEDRSSRIAELTARCFVAMNKAEELPKNVLGVGFGERKPGVGSQNDLVAIDVDRFEAVDWRAKAEQFESELGFFKGCEIRRVSEQEFP